MGKELLTPVQRDIEASALPNELLQMAVSNLHIVANSLGDDFAVRAAAGQLTSEDTIQANEILMDYLYPAELASLYRDRNIPGIKQYIGTLENTFRLGKDNLLNSIEEANIGMMIVRPEMVDFIEELEQFLECRGIEIFHRKFAIIDIEQYTVISEKGFMNPDGSYFDFATRTLNYVGKPSMTLLLRDKNSDKNNNLRFADKLCMLKGIRGQPDNSTIRGGPVFNCLTDIGSTDKVMSPGVSLAIDPIMAYRHIVDGSVPAPQDHIGSTSPLMYYIGQGIHTPDSNELARDISVMFTTDELTDILLKLNY